MAMDRATPDTSRPPTDKHHTDTVPSELLDALRISEARFRAVFENVDALSIQGYTADGTVRYWNPASSKLYGYSQNEAIGASLYDLIIPPPARDIVIRDVKWMFDHKQGVPAARLALKHKDGSTVHVYSSHTIVETPDHGAMMYCLDIDLREQVQMEQALSEAEQRYRSLFDGAADAILLAHRGHIVDANQAACALFGGDHDQLCTLTPTDLSPAKQPNGGDSADHINQLLNDVIAGSNRIFEWRHRRLDGTEFDAETHLTCVSLHGEPHVVGMVRDISARKQAEARIEYLAHHDALTGLPNRTLLRDRFIQARAQADRRHHQIALLFIDLDHFKVINDTLGHATGDVLLKIIAERLRHCVRESDTLSRQGGDEFILLLPDIRSASVLERLTVQLMAELTEPVTLGEHELTISGSVGVALYPQDGDNFDLLLQHGDMAMYSAKQAGRNKLRFYSAAMQVAIDKRISLDTRLRRALKARELQLHYQPQVDRDGRVLGAEALIRWLPPDAPPIPPLEFIGLAEETGLIINIGRYVLEQACTTLAAWAREPALRQLTLAVNISARQFRERDFETVVADVLQQSGCDPRHLKLELTESVVLDNVDDAIDKMQRLRQLGLGFSLDDFGTGYSSLSYLKRLPLDQVKIDRAFVHHLAIDRRDEAIVQAILGMSQAMQLSVIAEGVETSSQRDQLIRLGCHGFQGYWFAKPVTLSAFGQLMRAGGHLPSPMHGQNPPDPVTIA